MAEYDRRKLALELWPSILAFCVALMLAIIAV